MYFISDTNGDGIYMENDINSEINNEINNKKIKIHDINCNIKIKILKKINQNTKKGNFLLSYLGYNIYNCNKTILKCRYLLKSTFFNKKLDDYLLIIINYSGNLVIYKYLLVKKNNEKKYKYICVMYNQDSN
jgi:hypothetical protein